MAVEIYAPARELESGVIVPTHAGRAKDDLNRLFRREALPPEVSHASVNLVALLGRASTR